MSRRWILLLVVSLSVLVADQATKIWAVGNLTRVYESAGAETGAEKLKAFVGKRKLERLRTKPVVVHPDWFQLRYVENPGAAWGMLGGVKDKVRIPFFYGVSLFAIGTITVLFSRIRREQRLLALTFSLVLGGALGNFVDRAVRGYVIDFIDWHWRHQAHWPTFNIADVAISAGLVGLLLEGIFGRRRLPWISETAAASAEGVAAEGVAAEGVSAEGVSTEGVSAEGVSAEGVAAEGVAGEGVAAEGVSAEGVSAEGVAAGDVPMEGGPLHSALSLGGESREHAGAAGLAEGLANSAPAPDTAPDDAGAGACTPTSSPGSSRRPS